MAKEEQEEDILNAPNTITFVRILLTFVVLYFVLAKFPPIYIVVTFVLGAFTDFLDGQVARRFERVTEFGRKFDMIADRFLILTTVVALVLTYTGDELLSRWHILLIFLTLSREIVTMPIALLALLARKPIPHARMIGKVTTGLQGIALPAILLSIQYPLFSFAPYVALAACIAGILSGLTYIHDLRTGGKHERTRRGKNKARKG